MAKKNFGVRAWSLVRLVLFWARKGGVFKRRLVMELRVVPKLFKSLGHSTPSGQLRYGEHELSFDKTPIFRVKMHRPTSMRFNIPCITPQVDDFDCDFDEDPDYDEGRRSWSYRDEYETCCEEIIPVEEKGIDLRAEEFIANFYQQMKLQRQVSYLQYNRN